MFRAAAIALAGLVLVGCSTSARVDNPFKGDDSQKTQLAAFAAQSQYPNKQASDDLRAAALVDRKEGTIKIINTTQQALTDAKLWVNGAYVTHVDTIPARGMVTIKRENLYDRNGISLAKANGSINKVQLEMADKFYNLEGPAFEQ
ncbi:MAG TPA: hypothetical protein VGP99_11995 [Tepidisphaeraceae bacterium]|jgi:hypothetical protein|nr:hypothetical protein [Tepidisphaeraceae bacterium]